jgi:hypothetical protein
MAGLLIVRKVADSSVPHVTTNDATGRVIHINPETGRQVDHLPLLGVRPEGDLPDETSVSARFVNSAVSEGWAELVNSRVVYRPSGPPEDPWGAAWPPHLFIHADAITFHFLDGDVTYEVTHQPDKYADYEQATYPAQIDSFEGDDSTPVTPEVYEAGATRVDNLYCLKRK